MTGDKGTKGGTQPRVGIVPPHWRSVDRRGIGEGRSRVDVQKSLEGRTLSEESLVSNDPVGRRGVPPVAWQTCHGNVEWGRERPPSRAWFVINRPVHAGGSLTPGVRHEESEPVAVTHRSSALGEGRDRG